MLKQSNTQLNTCRVRTGDQWSMEHRLPLISEFIGARCSGLEVGKENQAKREGQFRLILRKFAERTKGEDYKFRRRRIGIYKTHELSVKRYLHT